MGLRILFFGFTNFTQKNVTSSSNFGSISSYGIILWMLHLCYGWDTYYMKHEIKIFCRGHVELLHAYKFI